MGLGFTWGLGLVTPSMIGIIILPPNALPLNAGTLLEVLMFREVGLHSHSGEGTRNARKCEILKDHASSAGYEPNAFLPPTEQVAWPSLPPPSQPPQELSLQGMEENSVHLSLSSINRAIAKKPKPPCHSYTGPPLFSPKTPKPLKSANGVKQTNPVSETMNHNWLHNNL